MNLKSNLKKAITAMAVCLSVFAGSVFSIGLQSVQASADSVSYTSDSINSFSIDGYTDEEVDMICAVVERETGGLSVQSKQIVTSVIINRINSSAFPNTVYDVLHQANQFNTIKNYYTNERPVQVSTRIAVTYVLKSGIDCADGAMYFYAPAVIDSVDKTNWFESNLEFVIEVDGQRYFR
jgi:spore germination cell wall hydrolase CwlJ-like protein